MRTAWPGTASNFIGIVLLSLLTGCAHPFADAYDAANGTVQRPVDSTGKSPGPYKVAGICPDQAGARLYNTSAPSTSSASGSGGGGTWIPTPCETYIVKSAIDYCIKITTHTDNIFNVFDRAEAVGASVMTLLGVASTAVGLAYGSAPAALAGAATISASFSGNFDKILPGSSPSEPVPTTMWGAATAYAQANQYAVVPEEYTTTEHHPLSSYKTNPFYAGLWNAVGTACPANLFGGSFKLASVDDREMSNEAWATSPSSTVVTVPIPTTPPALAALAGQVAKALNDNPVFHGTFNATQDTATSPVIYIRPIPPPAGAPPVPQPGQLLLTATSAGSAAAKTGSEVTAVGPGKKSETVLSIGGVVTGGDTITVTATWSVRAPTTQQ